MPFTDTKPLPPVRTSYFPACLSDVTNIALLLASLLSLQAGPQILEALHTKLSGPITALRVRLLLDAMALPVQGQ